MGPDRIIVYECPMCKETKEIYQKVYEYEVACECCNGLHQEIVWHCTECTPYPPYKITLFLKPKDYE